MYDDDRWTESVDHILDPVESIEEMLRKCGFFDTVVPSKKDDEALAN